MIDEDAKPVRIQRSRVKGWRMLPGAIYVGRPNVFGNRWRIGTWSNYLGRPVETLAEAAELYRLLAWPEAHHHERIRERLRGRDLVCWCPLTAPCHADWLLEVANR